MINKFLSGFFMLFIFVVHAQQKKQTCSTPKEDLLEDLNIITKCVIIPAKKKNSPKTNTRTLIKRKKRTSSILLNKNKEVAETNSLNTSGVQLNSEPEISESVEITKSIVLLANSLREEEVNKAETFMTVDITPTFKNCSKHTDAKRLKCFKRKLSSHINTHLNYPIKAKEKKIEGKIWVIFVIDSKGSVSNIETRGPKDSRLLTVEAARITAKLPSFIPGKKDGKNVSVKYSFPLKFNLSKL